MYARRFGIAALSLGAFLAVKANAATVFLDTFENGPLAQVSTKADDAWDSSDINWYSALSNGVASITNDTFAGSGSQRALLLSSPDTFRRMSGNFALQTLGSTIGDTITLSFDLRLAEAPTANAIGLRCGLYNSNGTLTTTDNGNGVSQPAEQNDDFGYYARMTTGSATLTNEIIHEPGGNNPTGSTAVAGEATVGTAASPVSINDQLKHSFVFQIVRSGVSQTQIKLTIDNVLRTTGTDNSPYTTFDTVYFAQGNISTDLVVDNVKLDNSALLSAVPTPSAAVLGGGLLAGLCLLGTVRAAKRRD